ncbi:MAG: hypothetical protein ACR2PG_16100, partial [Hyphomicrobiaceae bacterium]
RKFLTILSALVLWILSLALANAQDVLLGRGDAVVSGFSGVKPRNEATAPTSGSPLDRFFIDLEGPAVRIFSLGNMNGQPRGQLSTLDPIASIPAREVGQVFSIALDDGLGKSVPNIYLGATSAYGIQIVVRRSSNGQQKRVKRGQAGAEFMAGQFGPAPLGNPGTIWKIDGQTGAVSAFAIVPGNSGPAIGDIAFDAQNKQFFVSDLDVGIIHRFGADGILIDSFDHGQDGRRAGDLSPIADDGKIMDITTPSFNSEDPSTWGYTQSERLVYAMAVHAGRLYYAVAHGKQVWSVGINAQGEFAGDARLELEASALSGDGPVTDMLFDQDGRMVLAQRGQQRGSYNYATFAASGNASVVRYARQTAGNAEEFGPWQVEADEFAIGLPEEHRFATGGVALGYGHGENGELLEKACGRTIWSTGERLRSSRDPGKVGTTLAEASDVYGVQGNDVSLVRSQNAPPNRSYFVDYDGLFNDPGKSGHIGDIEIWQECFKEIADVPVDSSKVEFEIPPGFVTPDEILPPDLPEIYPTPSEPFGTNLKLTKSAADDRCIEGFTFWHCKFILSISNTGPDPYLGALRVSDQLPDPPPDSNVFFLEGDTWTCWSDGVGLHECYTPAVELAPGESIDLEMFVNVSRATDRCFVQNIAAIEWAPGGTRWNDDPIDDVSDATSFMPSPTCNPTVGPTNLLLEKSSDPVDCTVQADGSQRCRFLHSITNTGSNLYSGEVALYDEPDPSISAVFDWSCTPGGIGFDCSKDAVELWPDQKLFMWAWIDVAADDIEARGCLVTNQSWVTAAPGGTEQNLDPADDFAEAIATAAPGSCAVPIAAAKSRSCPPGYKAKGDSCVAVVQPPKITPVPGPIIVARCPAEMRKVRGSRVRRLRNQGWRLLRLSNGQWCGRPGPEKPPEIVCPSSMTKVAGRDVPRLRRQGWTLVRQKSGQWCGRKPATVYCPSGMRKVNAWRVGELRAMGWKLKKLKDGQWCGREPDRPEVVPCPRGMSKVSYRQVPVLRKTGWILRRLKNGQWCGRKPDEPEVIPCPKGMSKVTAWRVPILKKAGWTLTRLKNGQWCGRKPAPEICPTGTRTVKSAALLKKLKLAGWTTVKRLKNGDWCCKQPSPKQCNRNERSIKSARIAARLRKQGHKVRQIAKNHWCSSKPCKRGEWFRGGKCVPIVDQVCPIGTIGKWPKCKPVGEKCKRNEIRITSARRAKMLRREGRRVRKVSSRLWCASPGKPCKRGQRYSNGKCVPIVKPVCPKGTKGKYPKCTPIVKPKCPKGTTGRWPKCKPIAKRKCPKGTTGKWPKCKPITKRKCPKGTTGKWPKCKPIAKQKCPKGTKGRWPNCKKSVVKQLKVKLPKFKCPKGTVGNWPKCKRAN